MSAVRKGLLALMTRPASSRALCIGRIFFVLGIWLGTVTVGTAGARDRYRYVLEQNTNDKVCHHMDAVYNQHFGYPLKTPPLTTIGSEPDRAYGPNGRFAFPTFPGVIHDNRIAAVMRYSRFPTSPEFDAIKWREGRYRFRAASGLDLREQPMLVAQFDIDNDGRPDTVIKTSFMAGYWPSHDSVEGGEDELFVFLKGEIDLSRVVTYEDLMGGQAGGHRPTMISGGNSRRLIRPFLFDGNAYLSTYEQQWRGGEFFDSSTKLDGEYTNVLRYRGGGENLGHGNWSPLELEMICRFRMKVVR